MEPDEGPQIPESGELPFGQAIARELSIGEMKEDAAKRLTGQVPIPGTIGAKMPLENILAELGRRLPGATLTVPLG